MTCVLLRSHFSRGLDGVNSDTSFPSSSRMLEFSCLMTFNTNQFSIHPHLVTNGNQINAFCSPTEGAARVGEGGL